MTRPHDASVTGSPGQSPWVTGASQIRASYGSARLAVFLNFERGYFLNPIGSAGQAGNRARPRKKDRLYRMAAMAVIELLVLMLGQSMYLTAQLTTFTQQLRTLYQST